MPGCFRLGGVAFVLCLVSASRGLAAQQGRAYIHPRTAADSTALPFSDAVLVGNTLYLAGKIGLTADGTIPATVAEEARLALEAVKASLTAAHMTMDDLVSVQVFCSDVSYFADFNRVYRTYFTREFPARAFLGSGTLLFGARFEIQGIAVRR